MNRTFAELGYPGRLVALEGLDGAGKSTQTHLLKRWLQFQGTKVFVSQWDSSELVRQATAKGKRRELLTPITMSLLHATDFADRYERQVLPLLRAGYVVLSDCYVFTAYARDFVRGCPKDWVRGLYQFAARPDLVFFFKARLEATLERIVSNRSRLKYFESGMDLGLSLDTQESHRRFQGRILEQYLSMSTEFNFFVINAEEPIEVQQKMVRGLVSHKLDLSRHSLQS